jgi:hypothetical protein
MAQNETGEDYLSSMAVVERLSDALAEARGELTILEAEGSVEYFEENREYITAQAKVDTQKQAQWSRVRLITLS